MVRFVLGEIRNLCFNSLLLWESKYDRMTLSTFERKLNSIDVDPRI